LGQRLQDEGLNVEQVLRRSGLPVKLFSKPPVLLTTEQLFSLWSSIEKESESADIGLKIGANTKPERYDPVSISALCSRSFREAINKVARFKKLTCPEEVFISESENEISVRYEWYLTKDSEPPLLIDAAFSSLVTLGRLGTKKIL